MKLILSLVVATCFHFAQNAVIDELKDEFDTIEQDEAKAKIERETWPGDAAKDISKKDSEITSNDAKKANDAKNENKENSVESQLDDLLQSTAMEGKSAKKDTSGQTQLHKILTKFENSDVIDKDKLLNAIEKFMKKEVISADAPVEDSGNCHDVRKDCNFLARKGYCGTHKSSMEVKCAKTCQYCIDCKNIAGNRCKSFRKFGYCQNPKFRDRLKVLCYKECDYCRPPSPPKCSKTKYGCCWDKVTTMSDKVGSNCPECKDHYQYVCETFEADCEKNNRAGKFMRQFCSKKCGICGNKCADSVESALQCPSYARNGLCKTNKHAMVVLCKKTCELC